MRSPWRAASGVSGVYAWVAADNGRAGGAVATRVGESLSAAR